MREIRVLSWCEACWAQGEIRTEATTSWTVGITPTDQPPALHTLDACDSHAQDLIALQALAQLGERYVRKPLAVPLSKSRGGSAVFVPQNAAPCPICSEVLGKPSLVSHVWSQHRTDPRPAAPTACPTCRQQFENTAGVGAHRTAAHGYDALADALSGVKRFKPAPVAAKVAAPLLLPSPAKEGSGRRTTAAQFDAGVDSLRALTGQWVLIDSDVNVDVRRTPWIRRGCEVQGRNMVAGIGDLWARWPSLPPNTSVG